MNNKIDAELAGKRSLSAFSVAFELSATANDALAIDLIAQRNNGVAISDSAISKPQTASKYQRLAIVELSDTSKKALMVMFNIGDVAATCVNSYSLDKVASLGDMLATGNWHAQSDLQFKVWLSKAIDSENETDMVEWCAMFSNGKWAIDGKEIAKSPTQRNQCDTMAERLGMIKRVKSSGHSFTSWEKVDHKIWAKLDEIFDAHLVTE